MAREIFKVKITGSVRVKGPVITDRVGAAVGDVVHNSVKKRIGDALNLMDSPAKPLTPAYAKWKSTFVQYNKQHKYMKTWTKAYKKYKATGKVYKSLWTRPIRNTRLGQGLGRPVRDLKLTGEMLGNLTIRKATRTQVVLSLTARGPRMKAQINAKREEWLGFSRVNEIDVRTEAANQVAMRVGELVVKYTPSD